MDAQHPYLEELHAEALVRLSTEPHLLDDYETGSWVAFAGPEIVANEPTSLEAVVRARALGVEQPLLVRVLPPLTTGAR
jgi:hypothetical protein